MFKHIITTGLLLIAKNLAMGQTCSPIGDKIEIGSSDDGGDRSPTHWELQIAHFRGNGPALEYYITMVPGTFYSSSYFHHPALPSIDLPWVIKQELNPLRNYAKNPGEQWATIDKHFQEQPTTPTLIVDSLVHTFYLYPEERKQTGDDAMPQAKGAGAKNSASNLYPGLYKVTSDKPGTGCSDNAAVYVRLPRGAGGCEKFMYGQGPDLGFVRGGSGFYYEDVEGRGPWRQFFANLNQPIGHFYDDYWKTAAEYIINDPGVNNPIGYTKENFITHQLADGPEFWAKRRVVVTFQTGDKPVDMKHYEIMDFMNTLPKLPIPNPPNGFPPDLVRYTREMAKYLEAMQPYFQSFQDSISCISLIDLPDPNITPIEFTDDVIAFTKVYEVVNTTLDLIPNTPVDYLLPNINFNADITVRYVVRYGARTYTRYRCFSYDARGVNRIRQISLMWHALPDSYNITVFAKRK